MAKCAQRFTGEFFALSLSPNEAQVLRDICGEVSGDPNTSRRGLIDAIRESLDAAGLWYGDGQDHAGRIRFESIK